MNFYRAVRHLSRWDAHHRFVVAIFVAAMLLLFAPPERLLISRLIGAWIAFAGTSLAFSWNTIFQADINQIRRTAAAQDIGRTIIFAVGLTGACFSLLAIVSLIGTAKGLARDRMLEHAILSILSISYSWLLMHTLFAMRYAHVYYESEEETGGGERKDRGGLDFPGNEEPDYLDFAYFSFVIGMTCQVSDVQITHGRLRRLALVHGMLAFAFNTIILALSINLLSGLV